MGDYHLLIHSENRCRQESKKEKKEKNNCGKWNCGLTNCLIGIDRRYEHTNIGVFTTLRCASSSNTTVWTDHGLPTLVERSGGHSPYAASEPRCSDPDTDGRGEPGTGFGRDGPAKSLQARGRTHGWDHVPGRVQGCGWVRWGRFEKTAWSKFPNFFLFLFFFFFVFFSSCPFQAQKCRILILPVYPHSPLSLVSAVYSVSRSKVVFGAPLSHHLLLLQPNLSG